MLFFNLAGFASSTLVQTILDTTITKKKPFFEVQTSGTIFKTCCKVTSSTVAQTISDIL